MMRNAQSTYITTKKSPSFDGIASIIAYTELKNQIDKEISYLPVVSGRLDLITQKLLSYFDIKLPKYINNLQLRIEDIISLNLYKANKDQPITEVFKQMVKNDLRVVPIEDENRKFFGALGILDIAKKSISSVIPDIFRKIKASITSIKQAVEGVSLNEVNPNDSFVATVMLGVTDAEEFVKIVQNFDPTNIIMIVGNREDLQKKAIDFGVRCIVLSYGFKLKKELLEKAKANDVSVVLSAYDAFATAGLIEWSAPVSTICDKNAMKIYPSEFVDDVKEKIYSSSNRAAIVVDRINNIVGIITRTDIMKYSKRKVILINPTSITNTPDGIMHCDILEVIDNKIPLDSFKGSQQIRYRIEPWNSTSAIIVDELVRNKIDISYSAGMLLLASMLISTDYLDKTKTLKVEENLLLYIADSIHVNINELINKLKNMINL